jgi:hypothetical protein
MYQRLFIAFAILLMAVKLDTAAAGELRTGSVTCDFNSTPMGCEWKPKDCHKPTRPLIIASTISGYNLAVNEFNDYLQRAREYKECIVNDAESDIGDRFPALVIKEVKAETEQVDEDVESTRRSLDLAKIGANQ